MQKLNPVQVVALLAFFIALPLLVGAVYDKFNPLSVNVDDRFPLTYEQFKVETLEKMSERDVFAAGFRDEEKMRQAYENMAATHWNLVAQHIHRRLFMYGALALASLVYLLFIWFTRHQSGRMTDIVRDTQHSNHL